VVKSDERLTGKGEWQLVKKQLLAKVKNRESKERAQKQMGTNLLFNHYPLKREENED
jgi:hypothetical protein